MAEAPDIADPQNHRLMRLSRPGELLFTSGQFFHVAPLIVCSVVLFLFHPSIYSFLLIPICGFVTFISVGMTVMLEDWARTTEVYYDYCLRFAGCCIKEHQISEYVGETALKNANVVDLYPGKQVAKTSNLKVRIFSTSSNRYNPQLPTPQVLSAYIASPPFTSYIFVRGEPEKVKSPFQKYQILHELGHTNVDSQYLTTPLATKFYPYLWVILFALVNVRLASAGFIIALSLLGLFLWLIGRGLVRQLHLESWLLLECYADRFALANLPVNDGIEIFETHIKSGNHRDHSVSKDINEIRIRRFDFALHEARDSELGEHLQTPMLVGRYLLLNFMVIPLVMIGVLGESISTLGFVLNILMFVMVPIGLQVLLLMAASKTVSAINETIDKMKTGSLALHDPWLDIITPIMKLIRPI